MLPPRMSPGDSSLLYRRRCPAIRRRELSRFAARLSRELAGGRPFSCLLTGDGEMRRLQRAYRKKNAVTDVLSFPAAAPHWLGDLAISYDRARAQARARGHTIQEEVSILMLHGVLHLLGMDHERDAGEMAARERRLRRKFGLPEGLIERSAA
jgi:probable rRNA maturation factor